MRPIFAVVSGNAREVAFRRLKLRSFNFGSLQDVLFSMDAGLRRRRNRRQIKALPPSRDRRPDGTVQCEPTIATRPAQPVLAEFSLLTGNLTGNFATMLSFRRTIAGQNKSKSTCYREIPEGSLQGMISPKQGRGILP
jgi:hypothetical protein